MKQLKLKFIRILGKRIIPVRSCSKIVDYIELPKKSDFVTSNFHPEIKERVMALL